MHLREASYRNTGHNSSSDRLKQGFEYMRFQAKAWERGGGQPCAAVSDSLGRACWLPSDVTRLAEAFGAAWQFPGASERNCRGMHSVVQTCGRRSRNHRAMRFIGGSRALTEKSRFDVIGTSRNRHGFDSTSLKETACRPTATNCFSNC